MQCMVTFTQIDTNVSLSHSYCQFKALCQPSYYTAMGNSSEKHAACCQYLQRKFLFLSTIYGSDSSHISDGCQIVSDRDKTFSYPSWESLKVSRNCSEEAAAHIYVMSRSIGRFLPNFCALHYLTYHLMFLSCSKSRKLLFAEIFSVSIYSET